MRRESPEWTWSKHLSTQNLRGILSSVQPHRAKAASLLGRNVSRYTLVYNHISNWHTSLFKDSHLGHVRAKKAGKYSPSFCRSSLATTLQKERRCVFSTFCADQIPKLKSDLHTPYSSHPQMHNLLHRVEMARHVIRQTVNKWAAMLHIKYRRMEQGHGNCKKHSSPSYRSTKALRFARQEFCSSSM